MESKGRLIAAAAAGSLVAAGATILIANAVRAPAAPAGRSASLAAGSTPAKGSVSGPAEGFSALRDSSLPPAPESIVTDLRSLHPGTYGDAKDLGRGMYLATNTKLNAICAWVLDGFGQCTEPDRIEGDVWLQADMRRQYDAQTAPFEVNLYGFARDGVAELRVTTPRATTAIAVSHNAFRGTLTTTSFDDIASIDAVYTSGRAVRLDASSPSPGIH
jgi:hypothetical protein